MVEQRDYASILNAMIETAKAIGVADNGGDAGLACYQIISAAIDEAEVWGCKQGRDWPWRFFT